MAPPLIIAGMHRSGTSLVTRILEDAGLFVGRHLESNHESVFFLNLNRWVFRNAGATWDNPVPVRYLLAHGEGREVVTDYLRRSVQGRRAKAFFGGSRAHVKAGRWGWKDPRNTATLSLWLDVFPDATVLLVDRHGVDVAESLRARFAETWSIRRSRYDRYAPTYGWRASKHPVSTGFRVTSLEAAFGTWHAYQRLADEHTQGLGDRLLRFHYEDLLQHPMDWLPRLFNFAGLDVASQDTAAIAQRIDASRAYAYRDDPELAAFARTKAGALAEYGYAA